MTDIRPFWQFCIAHGPLLLGIGVVSAAVSIYVVRIIPADIATRYVMDISIRTISNAFFAVAAFATFYEAMRVGNIITALVELNSRYYEGGQVSVPVATEDELRALTGYVTRANYLALGALACFIIGWARQYGLMRSRRHRPMRDSAKNRTASD